jgi:hypothetical protein
MDSRATDDYGGEAVLTAAKSHVDAEEKIAGTPL